MMGSVAGVGQFLETVGVPGAQVGTQTGADNSTPGQDFASALQQAGGPKPQEVAGPVSSGEDAEVNGKSTVSGAATAANGSTGEQSGSVKTAKGGNADVTVPSGRRSVAGQLLGSAGRVVSATGAVTGSGKPTQTAGVKSVEAAGADETVSLEMGAAGVSRSGTATVPGTAVSGPVPVQSAVPASATVAAVPVKNAASVPTSGKPTEEPKAESAKTALKTDAPAVVDSKLSAMVPQGTTVVAQDGNVAAVAAAPFPVATTGGASNLSQTAAAAALDAPVAAAPSIVPTRIAAAVQGAGGKQPNKAAADRTSEAAPSLETATVSNVPVSGRTSTVQSSVSAVTSLPETLGAPPALTVSPAKAEGSTAQVATVLPGAAGTVTAPAAQPVAASQTVTAGSTEQANAGFEAALQTAGPAEAAALKPAAHGGRSVALPLKATSGPVAATASSVAAGPVVAAAKISAASAAGSPTVTDGAPGAIVHGTPLEAKANAKPGSVAVPPEQASPAVAAKMPTMTDGTPAVEISTKMLGDTGHAAAGAQPGAAPVEPVAVVAVSVPVPVVHDLGAGAAGGGSAAGVAGLSGATGVTVGAHDGGGVAGLSHTTLSSTPTSLEVGVSSGTHGWLKIRAELNAAGEVNASLTGANPAAAEKLRGELPALSNYLQDEKVTMGTLDVRSALHTTAVVGESGATFSQTGSGQGNAHQGSAGQTNTGGAAVGADGGSAGGRSRQQEGGDGVPVVSEAVGHSAVGDEGLRGRVNDAAVYASSMELGDSAGTSSVGYGAGGGWLNVRA